MLTYNRRFSLAAAAIATTAVVAVSILPGCDALIGNPFLPGTYSGELDCTMTLTDPSGASAEDEFTSPTTLVVGEDGSFTVNGVVLEVGADVVRSIPTADLAFEVTEIRRLGGLLTVTYGPRPTLPGIEVDGELVETYRWLGGSVQTRADTDLLITSVDGTSEFSASCEGTLNAE